MTQVLQGLSNDLATVVETAGAGAGVVRVEARRRLPASGIVWSADGLIMTAHHVVERDESISVGLPDGQTVPATLVGRDPSTDLALLRAEATGLTPPPWTEPDTLRVGHLALALGRPGKTVRATLGVIGALGESWVTPTGGRVEPYLQTDVTMYPGFSGGPLVDASGSVVGVNTSALLRGVSLVIPTPTVRHVAEALLATGPSSGAIWAWWRNRRGCRRLWPRSWARRRACWWCRWRRAAPPRVRASSWAIPW
jgi:S1-C subfamily serine protease